MMMVDLLNVKQDFISMVQKAQPFTLSHFIMWLDLKVAEYKVFGYMKLDQSAGTVPQIYNSTTEHNPSHNAPEKLSMSIKELSEPEIVLVPNQPNMQRGISIDNSTPKKTLGKMLRRHVYPVNKYSAYNRTVPNRMNNRHLFVNTRKVDRSSLVDSSKSDTANNPNEKDAEENISTSHLSVKSGYSLVEELTEPTGLYQNISNIVSSGFQELHNSSDKDSGIKTNSDQPDTVISRSGMDNDSIASNSNSANPDWEQTVDNSTLVNSQSSDIAHDSSSPRDGSMISHSHDTFHMHVKIEPESDDCLLISEIKGSSSVSKPELVTANCNNKTQMPGISDVSFMGTYSDHASTMYLTDHDTSTTYYPPVDGQGPDITSSFTASLVGTEKAPRNPVTGMLICSQCGASFKCRSSLSRHKALHGEKRHRCFICQRAFHRKEHLYTHLDRHAKNSDIACPICHIQGPSMQFIEKHYIQTHGSP